MSPALTLLYASRNSCWGDTGRFVTVKSGITPERRHPYRGGGRRAADCYLQAGLARIDEAEDRIRTAEHNTAVWRRHGGDRRDGILSVHGFIRADLFA